MSRYFSEIINLAEKSFYISFSEKWINSKKKFVKQALIFIQGFPLIILKCSIF